MEKFYENTISGADLKVKFAFPKSYFTKKAEDLNKSVFYDIGILSDIAWNTVNSASAKFCLSSTTPIDIVSGMSISQGEFIFKNFQHSSLSLLKKEILKGINEGTEKLTFPVTYDNPFVLLDDDEDIAFETTSEPEKLSWSQMPLFDIVLISSASSNNNKEVRMLTISGVKITSNGFAESFASLELNTMASFIAIGGVSDWELINNE